MLEKHVRVTRMGGLIFVLLGALAVSLISPSAAPAQTLTTLVNFDGSNGQFPSEYGNGLIADASGNLFGTTETGGASGDGTIFEITKTATGYASTPITLASFDGVGSNGRDPDGGVMADANGNLFGTTSYGGANFYYGTVFELAKTTTGYASTPTTVVSFNGSDGQFPLARLMADANGNLLSTTQVGGATFTTPNTPGIGTVFEIVKTATGYASTPTTLISFNGVNGDRSEAGLITDTKGDLFGTTTYGGASYISPLSPGYGTVFEIAKTASGYANTPTTLINFNGSDGAFPDARLIADANGNLFSTTDGGGASGDGTVFEIAKTASGYASTPTTLVSFDGTDGWYRISGLIADAEGDLFGTTTGGGLSYDSSDPSAKPGYGTVFEVSGSGFIPPTKFVRTPGTANCVGGSISVVAKIYGGEAHAATALGYANVADMRKAITSYCAQ